MSEVKRRFWVWCDKCDTVLLSWPSSTFRLPVHPKSGKRCTNSGKEGELHE